MKTLISLLTPTILLIVFIYVVSFAGCNNIITTPLNNGVYQSHSERDFLKNRNLRAEPGSVVILNLETANSPADTIPDTGIIGEDIIPIRYTENAVHNVRIQDSAAFAVALIGAVYGDYMYFLYSGSPSATVTIPAGDYYFRIISYVGYDSTLPRSQTVFIRPNAAPTVSENGHYEASQLNTFFGYMCGSCNLNSANMYKLNLRGVYLGQAAMQSANLNESELDNANLEGANLTSANIRYASLRNAHLIGTILTSAVFYQSDLSFGSLNAANLTYANINNCNLSYSNFSSADISFADLCGSNKTGMISDGITFNSHTLCWP